MSSKPRFVSLRTWPPTSRVRHFYRREFRPWLIPSVHQRTVENYDTALNRYERFCGGSPRLEGVTHERLEEFKKWLPSKRCSALSARIFAGCIRKVAKAWRGHALPRLEELAPADAKSLRGYFASRYRTEALIDCLQDTIDSHARSQRALYMHHGGDVFGEELESAICSLLESLRKRGLPATTVNGYRRMLLAVWRHGFEAGFFERSPRIKKLKEIHNPPESWTVDEMKKLLSAAQRFRVGEFYGPLACHLWWTAIINVAYETGLRRRTLLSIRQRDIAGGWLRVDGGSTKNLKGQSFKLSERTLKALHAIWEPARARIFDYTTEYALHKHFRLLIDAAQIRRCYRKGLGHFHMIRRTTATLIAARAGIGAASKVLGHSDIEVTKRYVDPTQMMHDATSILPELSAG